MNAQNFNEKYEETMQELDQIFNETGDEDQMMQILKERIAFFQK